MKRGLSFKIPLLLFLSLLCFYSLLLSARFDGYERGFYATACNFFTGGGFNMGDFGLANTAVIGGKRYCEYVLQSILDVPLVGAGIILDSVFAKASLYPDLQFFLPKAFNAVLTSLTAVVVYLFGVRLYKDKRISLTLAFIYGLATMAVPYATIGMDPLFTFLTIFGFYLIKLCSEGGGPACFALTGLVFGLAMGAKTYAFIAYPFAALYLFLLCRENKIEGLRRKAAALMAGGLAGLIPWFWYNYLRFGLILPLGRTTSLAGEIFGSSRFSNFIDGIYGTFFSAGKSFFLYSPPLVFAFWGFSRLLKKNRPEAVSFLSFSVFVVLFFCSMDIPLYWADEVWGTRYYLVLVPFLVLTLGSLLPGMGAAGFIRKVFFYLSIFLGFMVQIPGSLVYYGRQTGILVQSNLYTLQNAFYIPAFSHLRINAFLIMATLRRNFTGVFPSYYYYPRSNIWYNLSFKPIRLSIDPDVDYIELWWHRALAMPDLSLTSKCLVISLVLVLFAGFVLFGVMAYKAANAGLREGGSR